ncbi:MAG: Veg family protein [Lachnospiraceae bacterium]|nr:Veg family protein [Lachnospiraceae bacterium]
MTQQELQLIRRSIKEHVGYKIQLSANKGRHQFETSEGIILETYPNIFVVQIISDRPEQNNRKVSFSYHDVITRDVRMSLL